MDSKSLDEDQRARTRHGGLVSWARHRWSNPVERLTASAASSRLPELKFLITEQPGDWPKYEIDYLQSVYESGAQHRLRDVMHRSPGDLPHQPLCGGQFHVNREAKMFVDLGFEDRAMWGSDYPPH